jgi:hypothetical protein
MLFLGVETEKDWINSIEEIPVLGHLFIFALVFIPPVIGSFIAQALIPDYIVILVLQNQCCCYCRPGI